MVLYIVAIKCLYLYASINNLLQSALRLTADGSRPDRVQMILQRLYPVMMEKAEGIREASPTEDDLYTFAVI
jgi:urease accessory protein